MADKISFDQAAFLEEHFSTPDGVLGLVAKYFTTTPQRPAVVKWFKRSSIPSDWVFQLLYVIEQENAEPLSMGSYFSICGGAGEGTNDIFG